MISRPRGISFNRNAVNIINTANDQPTAVLNANPKGLALAQEPEAPVLKSHMRESLQLGQQQHTLEAGNLKPQLINIVDENSVQNNDENKLINLKNELGSKYDQLIKNVDFSNRSQQVKQQQELPIDDLISLVDLDTPVQTKEPLQLLPQQLPQPPPPQLERLEIKRQPKPAPQQESLVSRIPRLSRLKLSFGQTANAQPSNALKPKTLLLNQLAPLIENKKNESEDDDLKRRKLDNILTATNKNLTTLKPSALLQQQVAATTAIEEIEDIDKSTSRDAIYLVCEIAKDIYQYMYELEDAQSVKQDYLKEQKIFTPKVRQRLINWCIETHARLELLPETLYMTIALIDRYFELVIVKQQSQVQLIAIASLLIASKYEEIYPPEVKDLVHLSQNIYTRREILHAETEVLQRLNYNLGKPIPLAFLRRFSKAAHCDLKMHSIAKYFMELSLTEYECCHWKPSMLAAAALFATIHLVRQDSMANSGVGKLTSLIKGVSSGHNSAANRWNKTLVHYTHYTREQLQEPAGILCKILKRSQKSPQSYVCVKKNQPSSSKWLELKSIRVDELIKLSEQA